MTWDIRTTGRNGGWRTLGAVMALVVLLSVVAAPAAAQGAKRRRAEPPAAPAAPPVETPPTMTEEERKQMAEAASRSRANLIAASQTYRESLERLMALQKDDEKRASELVERRKRLLDLGVIARREVEESEQGLAATQAKVAETVKQLEQIDLLISEVNAAEQLANQPPEPVGTFKVVGALVRYVGSTHWALSDFGKVDAFYRLKFGRPLPVSAFGQTETHNRLGFDHREALDVAVHPDSPEGQELIQFLMKQGISFIAIRSAIPGSATGAHLHIGSPSRKLSAQ